MHKIYLFLLLAAPFSLFSQTSNEIRNLLIKIENPDSQMVYLDKQGSKNINSNSELANRYYDILIEKASEFNSPHFSASANNSKGIIQYYKDDYNASNKYYFLALEILEASPDDHELLSRIYNNIAWNMKVQGLFPDSKNYFLKSLSEAKKGEITKSLPRIYNNLGVVYKNLELYDSALFYYDKALEINRETSNKKDILYNLNNISAINIFRNNFTEARANLEEASNINSSLKDTIEWINIHINYSRLFQKMNNNSLALSSLTKSYDMATLSNQDYSQMEVLRELILLYEKMEQIDEAYESYKLYSQIKDTLFQQDQILILNELRSKYDLSNKEKELQIARNQNLQQQNFLYAVSLGAIILSFTLFYVFRIYRLKHKNEKKLSILNNQLIETNKLIKEKNEEIMAQSEELSEYSEEIRQINEHLEEQVRDRSKALRAKHERLFEYAKMNAHDVRGPLARILGLVQILNTDHVNKETQNYLEKIKLSAEELDHIIHVMNDRLTGEDQEELK